MFGSFCFVVKFRVENDTIQCWLDDETWQTNFVLSGEKLLGINEQTNDENWMNRKCEMVRLYIYIILYIKTIEYIQYTHTHTQIVLCHNH